MMSRADDVPVNSGAQRALQVLVIRESHAASLDVAENLLLRRLQDGSVIKSVYMRRLRSDRGAREMVGLEVGNSFWRTGYRDASRIGHCSKVHWSVHLQSDISEC